MSKTLLTSFCDKEALRMINKEFTKKNNLVFFLVSEHYGGYKAEMFDIGKNGYIKKTDYWCIANTLEHLRELLPIKELNLRRMENDEDAPEWLIERWY